MTKKHFYLLYGLGFLILSKVEPNIYWKHGWEIGSIIMGVIGLFTNED